MIIIIKAETKKIMRRTLAKEAFYPGGSRFNDQCLKSRKTSSEESPAIVIKSVDLEDRALALLGQIEEKP